MKIIGIICEYNPFHLGHEKQLRRIRQTFGGDCAIVCAMSGNYVQRGAPAIVDKSLRAEAAVRCGADLVLELPVTTALSSAEGFAAGGVALLARVCDVLCFGAEDADGQALLSAAQGLLAPGFPPLLRRELETGKSFPAARQSALERMGIPAELLSRPNNILAVEYCKAILSQKAPLEIFPICREGSYHALTPDPENPSATAVRQAMVSGQDWRPYVPSEARQLLEGAAVHTTAAGERAVLQRLRSMTEQEFADLPYGSEGLWRKLMHASRREARLEEILTAVKSKRYTRSRLDRMVLCAFLGITAGQLAEPAPYIRVLAFSHRGRGVLKAARETGLFLHAGQSNSSPYWELERRWDDLYGLFTVDGIAPPGAEKARRVRYCPERP